MKHVLITSGGSKIEIDQVRSITNMSGGTFGSNIATEFLNNYCMVHYLCNKKSVTPFKYVADFTSRSHNHVKMVINKSQWCESHIHYYREYHYETFDEYDHMLCKLLSDNTYDAVLLAAAISDYTTEKVDGKIRSKNDLSINLVPTEKIISKIHPLLDSAYFVGFKLLVDSSDQELIYNARQSIINNKCDAVIANDLSDIRRGQHRILYVTSDDVTEYKDNLAANIHSRVAESFK